MKISIFGLGYVGCVSAACLAEEGHEIIGVDINRRKVEMIQEAKSPIIEKGIDELIRRSVENKKIRATDDTREAVHNTQLSFICVGTPSRPNGSLNYDMIEKTCEEIGKALKDKKSSHIVIIRSTVLPGCIRDVIIPALEKKSGKREGKEFYICVNPEFLREGTSIKDFYDPPFILIGLGETGKGGSELMELYKNIKAEYIETSIEAAEMIKYACNAFHAMKVVFANEMGNICKSLDIDGQKVMKIFCNDKKLTISSSYLLPGFAFGGSCLPKDLRALMYKAKENDIITPLLNSLLSSNQTHFNKAVEFILSLNKRKIGVLGLSFKEGTDDLRESPNVALVEFLIGKGLDVKVYDKNVLVAKLLGSNRDYIEKQIPHISRLMEASLESVVAGCEVLVVGSKDIDPCVLIKHVNKQQIVFDLVNLFESPKKLKGKYFGICW
jgi:nucleotide sugar dehydrogenase